MSKTFHQWKAFVFALPSSIYLGIDGVPFQINPKFTVGSGGSDVSLVGVFMFIVDNLP